MKYIFTLFLVVCFQLTQAQISIDKNTSPLVFDQLVYRSYNMNAYINLGDSGANSFWDLSSFNLLVNDSIVEDYLNVSGSFKTTHPTANIMIKRNQYGYTSYKFFNNTNNYGNFDWVGTQNASPPSYHVYSNSIQYLTYPLVYKQARIDAFKYRSQGFDSDSGTYQGTVKVTYPGWGRVKISNNQFYDSCLMELKIFNESNSKGEPERYIEVNFYSSKFRGAIVRAFVSFYYDGSNFISTGQNVNLQLRPSKAYKTSNISNVFSDNISIYPNPFNQNLFIKTTTSEFSKLLIINSLGQEMVSQQLTSKELTEIDMSGLPPSIYTLLLIDANGHQFSKQIVKSN